MSSDFVALQCPNCGGNLSVTKEKMDELFIKNGDAFVYIGNGTGAETIECESCKTKFERRQRVAPAGSGFSGAFNQAGQTVHGSQINIATGGGAIIGGNVTIGGSFIGGNLITGSGNRVERRQGGKGEDFVGGHTYINGKRVD